MTRSGRSDLLFVVLLVSAAIHFGMMIWARPKVMTEVASGFDHVVRRGPMRVGKEVPEPEPVKIAVVRDVAPEKGAPTVDETVALLPAAAPSLPALPEQSVSPAEVATGRVIEKPAPESAAPVFEMPAAPEKTEIGATRMDVETPKGVFCAQGTLADLATRPDAPPAPAFEAPVFGTTPKIREIVSPERMTRKEDPPETPKPEFKPPQEVMERVDEKIVEAEKQSVRELLDVDSASDIKTRINVALEAYAAGGYTYFRATLSPKPRLPAVPKDFVVLLDASGSVGWDRLTSCREAARDILRTATNTGDRFNIVAFRDRYAYAFRNWRPCDAESFAAGERWLSKLGAHGRTDVFSTIASVLTLPRDPARPLIALVITDGEANTGVSETAQILARFSKLNDGLVSVYMYGVKDSANRELIDVLTRGNRGESFIYDGWRWKAGEGLGPLSERFRDPLLTDLQLVFPSVCPAEAYPVRLKNVYRGNTTTVIGRVAGSPAEISFQLRGLAAKEAFEGYYRFNAGLAKQNAELPKLWQAERNIDSRLRSWLMFEVIALAVLQGVAEFLPISSSGHLVLGKSLLGLSDTGMRLDIFLHVGTLFAIAVFYWSVIWRILRTLDWRYALKVVVSAIPAGIVGVLFKDELEALFASPRAVGCALCFTGIVLTALRFLPQGAREVSFVRAFVMGIAQAVAILPGVSRSGMTIAAARVMKVDATKCAEFSFLMSAPPIAGAALLDALKMFGEASTTPAATETSWGLVLLGALVAGVVGYFSLKLLVRSLTGRWFWLFGPYCMAAGLLTLILV